MNAEEKAKILKIMREENKLSKIYKIVGQRNLLKTFNNDIGLIKIFLKSKVKGNISGYIRELKKIKEAK